MGEGNSDLACAHQLLRLAFSSGGFQQILTENLPFRFVQHSSNSNCDLLWQGNVPFQARLACYQMARLERQAPTRKTTFLQPPT